MAIRRIDSQEFKELICDYNNAEEWKFFGQRPAVVDFYAAWCGPCKLLAPTLEALSEDFEGKVDFYKVDTDSEPELCAAFGIEAIPTLIYCPKQGLPKTTQGFVPEPRLREIIESII